MLKTLFAIVLIGGGGYLALVAFVFSIQRSLLYFPSKETVTPGHFSGLEGELVTFRTEDGLDLRAWFTAAKERRPVVLYLHGNGGHIGHRRDKIAPYIDAGVGVLLLGYRGYGGNDGNPNEEGLYRDAAAALRFLGSRGIEPPDIVLYGESLGTGVAAELASRHRFAGLVLEAPFSSMTRVARHHYGYLPVGTLLKDRYDSRRKITLNRAPLLVLHGRLDKIVPIRYGTELFEAAPPPKTFEIFERAGHNDLYDHGASDKVLKFIAELPENGLTP